MNGMPILNLEGKRLLKLLSIERLNLIRCRPPHRQTVACSWKPADESSRPPPDPISLLSCRHLLSSCVMNI